MGLTREERIARELQKQCPGFDRHHYIVISSPDGVVSFSGASSPRMKELLAEVTAEALGIKFER